MSRKGRKKGRSGKYRQPVRVTGTGTATASGTPTATRSVSQARVGGDGLEIEWHFGRAQAGVDLA